jgi:hypothetical protein
MEASSLLCNEGMHSAVVAGLPVLMHIQTL